MIALLCGYTCNWHCSMCCHDVCVFEEDISYYASISHTKHDI